MRKSLVLRAFGLIGLAAWLSLPGCARAERESSTEPVSQDGFYEETYRPRYHFTPPEKWMNDSNGMVYHDSEYHLFYQYNPEGILWGHMSWGHAVSPDMLHWQHLPVALRDTPEKMYFSGSAVFDQANSSGLGSAENPPLVAIYTAHMHSRDPLLQRQELAYSTDRGRTWTLYDGNPVLDIGESDFRDPKVFWHEASRRWIMAVSLANEKRIQFYSSSDLKRWDLLSQFGPAGAPDKHNWECPDLFELPVENGGEGETRWVLATDMGSAAIAGGSGAEYFVGTFDGTAFTGDDPPERVRWVDYGADFYASQSFSGIPPQDGRRIWLAWMNNWDYARDIPTDPWRGMMSIPRQLSLRRVGDDLMLVQRPVEELQRLRGPEKRLQVLTWGQGDQGAQGDSIEEVNRRLASQGIAGASLEIVTRLRPVDGQSLGLSLRQGGQEETRVGYDPAAGEIFVDRSRSGVSDFHEGFAARHAAPLDPNEDGTVTLHIFLDHSSVEVFAGDGLRVISDRIFPSPESTAVKLFGAAGAVEDLSVWPLNSVWTRQQAEAKASRGRSGQPQATLGVSLLTLSNPFFRDLAEGMHAEARRHGFEVLVTAGEFDTLKQYNQVADFIVKRVDAIVLAPCDSRSVATAINNANRAGIPVFTVDIACLAPEAEVVSHIASDNYGGGRLAATALIEALGGSGKVAILDHPEVESVILRTRGFLEVVEEARREGRADIQLVAQLPTSGVKDRAFKVAEDILQSHPDLDAFFAINDVTALGAVAAVEKAGKQEQVKVVGFDGLPEGRQAIQDGKIYADPVQFPREIGRRAVLAVAAYLQGLEVSERVLVPTRLYRTTDSHPPEPPEDSEL